MPKNKPLKVTPFTLFMKHRKNQLNDEGLTFDGGWKDVAQHISDEWMNMDEGLKSSWQLKAERMNERAKFVEVNRLEEKQQASNACRPYEKRYLNCEILCPEDTIMNYFRKRRTPVEEIQFSVVHFNSYGRYYSHICVPSEFALESFSLIRGIEKKERWNGKIIDPGVLPTEVSMVDVSEVMSKTSVPRPPYCLQTGLGYYSGLHKQQQFENIFEEIVQHSLLMEDSKTGRELHILFAPNDADIVNIRGCILWLMMICDRKFDFEILNLSTLVKMLSFHRTKADYDKVGIWDEKEARSILDDSTLNFVGHLACDFHQREENINAINNCAVNIVTRSIYLALGALCIVYEMECMIPSHMTDLSINTRYLKGEHFIGKLEYRQRFGLEVVDDETKKFLKRQFILPNFLAMLKNKFSDGLPKQPTTIIWPKNRDVEKDLNYSTNCSFFVTKCENVSDDDEPDEKHDSSW